MTSILIAAAAAALPPICTDRPTKANATCTVPAGRIQLETSLGGWSLTKAQGAQSKLLTIGSTFAKIGLSSRSDLQVGLTPYVHLVTTQGADREASSGFGDTVVRYKQRITGDDAKVQVGVIPFVKLPTAKRPLGNRKLEGGIAVPIGFTLGGPVTMTLGPEVDWLSDSDGHGRHLGIINLVNVAGSIAPRLNLIGELWTNFNFDPAGTVKQASADAALAYTLSDRVQFDAGSNFGLTRDTPDVELYAGFSVRF